MKGRLALFASIYLAWISAWLIAASLPGGEIAESAHLWLILSGLPSALFSLALPNASLPAIAMAGLLGVVQWVGVAAFVVFMGRRRQQRD